MSKRAEFVCLWIQGRSVQRPADMCAAGRDVQEDTGEQEEAQTGSDTPKQSTGNTCAPTGFTVLGGFENKPIQKVKRSVKGAWGSPVSLVFIHSVCVYSAVCRCTESCLSGSLSPMSFTETLKGIWSPFLTSQDFLLSSWKNYKIMEFSTFFQVMIQSVVAGSFRKLRDWEQACVNSLNAAVSASMSHTVCHISAAMWFISLFWCLWCICSRKAACAVWVGLCTRAEKFTLKRSFKKLKKVVNYWCIDGYSDFFTVQTEVIPAILESALQGLLIGRGGFKPRDICVSAPTGSGKTLAFVVPVIQVSSPVSCPQYVQALLHVSRTL